MMDRYFRYVLFAVSILQAILGVGFALQIPILTQIWPFPNTSPLSFIFIGSIYLAAAASTLWSLLAGENGSLAGVFLDYIVIFVPLVIFMLQIANGNEAITWSGIGLAVGVLFGIVFLLWSLRFPIQDTRPQPLPVRVSFMIFVVALIFVGGALVLQVPNILPWRITPEGSVIYGWMFLGAASYFIYSLLRPSWMNTGGQLAGFLAYDIVLIVPFINHFSQVSPQLLPNLIIYTIVVVFSGLLAIYYLFVHEKTRINLRQVSTLPVADPVDL